MSELPDLPVPLAYEPFLSQALQELPLSPAEQPDAANIHPANWALWGLSVFSGNEHVTFPYADDELKKSFPGDALQLFGSEVEMDGVPVIDFRQGELALRLRSMYERRHDSETRRRFARGTAIVGAWAHTVVGALGDGPEGLQMPRVPQAVVYPDASGVLRVEFTERSAREYDSYPMDMPVTDVVTLGPGLTGAGFAGYLAGWTDRVHLVSGGMAAHFVNQYNRSELEVMRLGLARAREQGVVQEYLCGVPPERAHLPEVAMYADGIAAALGQLSAAGSKADYIGMVSVHTAGVREGLAGVRGAKQLLREGGVFLVSGPDTSRGDEAGMDRMMPEATGLFGEPAMVKGLGPMEMTVDVSSGVLSGGRPSSFAIFRQS